MILQFSGDLWAAEYLDTDKNVIDWSREFLEKQSNSLGGPDPVLLQQSSSTNAQEDQLWAEQYLEDAPTLQNNVPTLDPIEFQVVLQ